MCAASSPACAAGGRVGETTALPGFARTLARLVAGRNIEPQTLLATDYLNHFNEIVMLLEMLPDMPDMLDEVQAWQPKGYAEHFRDSVFADRELAILAYENAPPRYRVPFDETVSQMDRLVLTTVAEVAELIAAQRTAELGQRIADTSVRLGRLMDRAGAIIHGDTDTLDQRAIDSMIG